MAFHVRAASAVFGFFAAIALVHAGDMCPAPPRHSKVSTTTIISNDDHRIHIDSDDATVDALGRAELKGKVKVTQDSRTVSADSMNYDNHTGKIDIKGAVDFEDPKLRIKSDAGIYDTLGGAVFDEANFFILDRNGRGFAKQLDVTPDGKVALEQVRYTTCPVGNQDWMMQASAIDLDTAKQEGVGHHVHMAFKGVPIFYTPYISFPLGDERKSGLLFPSFAHSQRNGYDVEVPVYFNLAPNYDLTLTPGVLSRRGVQLGTLFRYLTPGSHGQIETNFLPSDSIEHSNRDFIHLTDTTDFKKGLRFDADIASVSDSAYFQDFAVGSEQTSVTYLERRAEILYYDDTLRVRGQLQNFQTMDVAIRSDARPYSRVPRLQVQGLWPVRNSNFEFSLDSEATNFLRSVTAIDDPAGTQRTTGLRVDFSPEIRWSNRGPGYYLEPAIGYHFTQYDLHDVPSGNPTTPTRTMPYARVDAGVVFERDTGSKGQRTQTLEPRVMYSYVPYRNQDELPVFDSGLPDQNLTELFRTNRYVGNDRIGDANQVALGVTTRLFDNVSGTQYLSATLGQIRYFSIPRVTVPYDPNFLVAGTSVARTVNQFSESQLGLGLAAPYSPYQYQNPVVFGQQFLSVRQQQILASLTGQALRAAQALPTTFYPASDLVAEVALTAYKHVSVNMEYQWNPYSSQTDKSEIAVQYRPDSSRVVNLGYRFQNGILKQWDGSFAWPVAGHWNTVGRWVYSIQDKLTIEQVAGFEYKSCCWRVQIVQRRYVSNRVGGLDTSFALQLELTGLSSVGKAADAFLEKEIRGYSVRDPDPQQSP